MHGTAQARRDQRPWPGPVRSALRMADSEQARCRVVDGEALKELGRRLHCPSCTQGYVDATCLKDRDGGVSTATIVHVTVVVLDRVERQRRPVRERTGIGACLVEQELPCRAVHRDGGR